MTALFLVWTAELDQYVFQDSQLEGLGKDIFSKLGGGGFLVQPAFPSLFLRGHGNTQRPPFNEKSRSLPSVGTMRAHLGHPLTVCLGVFGFFSEVEHIGLEEMISESVEVLEDSGRKSQKRCE